MRSAVSSILLFVCFSCNVLIERFLFLRHTDRPTRIACVGRTSCLYCSGIREQEERKICALLLFDRERHFVRVGGYCTRESVYTLG